MHLYIYDRSSGKIHAVVAENVAFTVHDVQEIPSMLDFAYEMFGDFTRWIWKIKP